MATGYMINITRAEALHLLQLYRDWQAYKADHDYPPPGAGLSRGLETQVKELMDNLARWIALVNQEGLADGISKVTAADVDTLRRKA